MVKSKNELFFQWESVRIFISSTFRDFHAERDYLVKYVFPKLREWCEKWKLHLIDIDLRWGVTPLEAESGKVIDICLEQIDGSRPFFICMLGNRYGWVPKKSDVPENTRKHYDKLDGKENFSVTHLEIHHAVLEPLSSVDIQEQVPHAFFYFRDTESLLEPQKINEFSAEDKKIYSEAFFESNPENQKALLILKENIKNHYSDLKKTRKEISEPVERIFNYQPVFDPKLSNPEDNRLKGRFTKDSLKILGDQVESDLKKAIGSKFKNRIETISLKMEEDPLKNELDFHELFVENRTRIFIGRSELLENLNQYVNSASNKILAVYGEPGSGKSALLAKFYQNLKRVQSSATIKRQQVIPHFIGASPSSSSVHNILIRMCEELKNQNEISDEIPTEINKLNESFKSFLNKVKQKTVIILDSLNQLDEFNDAHNLNWLPNELPKNIKIIASTLEGDVKKVLEKKTDEFITISPLRESEQKEIIKKVPSVFCKTLNEQQIKALLTRKETRNPLYLKVALEELRIFGSFEKLEKKIKSLPDNIIDLFESVLVRLEEDNGKEIVERLFCLLESSRFGLTITELSELMEETDKDLIHRGILRQIRDYLYNRGEVIDFFHRGLSKAVRNRYLKSQANKELEAAKWHRILAQYFMNKPVFFDEKNKENPNIRKAIEQPWQQIKANMWDEAISTLTDLWFMEAKVRAGLAFELQEDYDDILGGLPEVKEKLATNLKYKEALNNWVANLIAYAKKWSTWRDKIGSGKLIGKFTKKPDGEIPQIPGMEIKEKNNSMPANENSQLEKIKEYGDFIKLHSSSFYKFGKLMDGFLIQQVYNQGSTSSIFNSAEEIIETIKNKPILKKPKSWKSSYIPIENLSKVIDLDVNDVTCLSVSANGNTALVGAQSGDIIYSDNLLIVVDIDTGKIRQVLKGHVNRITSCVITPDGQIGISGSADKTIRIWDIRTGACLKVLKGHTGNIEAVSATPDCHTIISGGAYQDDSLKIWRSSDGDCVYTSPKCEQGIYSVAITPDGRIGVSGGSWEVRVWDLLNKRCLYAFKESGQVKSVAVSVDNKLLLTGSGLNGDITIWNLSTGENLGKLTGHSNKIYSVQLSADKRRVISSSLDGTLRIWDLEKKECIHSMKNKFGIHGDCSELSMTPDGVRLVSGGGFNNGNIYIWDFPQVDFAKQEEKKTSLFIYGGWLNKAAILNKREDIPLLGIMDYSACKDILINNKISLAKSSSLSGDKNTFLFSGISENSKKSEVYSKETLCVWDVNENKCKYIFEDHKNMIYSTAITSDGRCAVSGGGEIDHPNTDSVIRVWDLINGECKYRLKGHIHSVHCLKLTPDDRILLSSSYSGMGVPDSPIKVWDVTSGELIHDLKGHKRGIKIIEVSENGRIAVTSCGTSGKPDIRVWDIAKGVCLHVLKGHDLSINSIRITPDSKCAVSASQDKTIRVWDIASGKPMQIFNGHSKGVDDLQITQDGRLAISCSSDNTIRVWDLSCGECVAVYDHNKQIGNLLNISKDYSFLFITNAHEASCLKLENYLDSPPICTASRLWIHRQENSLGYWDDKITSVCSWCGIRFLVPVNILDKISTINDKNNIYSDNSPCLKLPLEAWKERELLSGCPACKNQLRFNPFVVDFANKEN